MRRRRLRVRRRPPPPAPFPPLLPLPPPRAKTQLWGLREVQLRCCARRTVAGRQDAARARPARVTVAVAPAPAETGPRAGAASRDRIPLSAAARPGVAQEETDSADFAKCPVPGRCSGRRGARCAPRPTRPDPPALTPAAPRKVWELGRRKIKAAADLQI